MPPTLGARCANEAGTAAKSYPKGHNGSLPTPTLDMGVFRKLRQDPDQAWYLSWSYGSIGPTVTCLTNARQRISLRSFCKTDAGQSGAEERNPKVTEELRKTLKCLGENYSECQKEPQQ